MTAMNKQLVQAILDDFNKLIVDETNSTDAGHYKRVLKLAHYAEKISQMGNVRVAGVTDRHGRLVGGGGIFGGGGILGGVDGGAEAEREAAMDDQEIAYNNMPLPMLNGIGGGPQDMTDLLREMLMVQQQAREKPESAGKLAADLQSLLDAEDRLRALDQNDDRRAALPAIRANIKAVTAKLEDAANPKPKAPIHAPRTEVANPQFLRRHPPHLDVAQDVHAAGGEVDAGGEAGARDPRAQGPEQGLDPA